MRIPVSPLSPILFSLMAALLGITPKIIFANEGDASKPNTQCNQEWLEKLKVVRPTMRKEDIPREVEYYLQNDINGGNNDSPNGMNNWRIPVLSYSNKLCPPGVWNELARQFPHESWFRARDKSNNSNHNLEAQVADLVALDQRLVGVKQAAQAVMKESKEILATAKELGILDASGAVVSGEGFMKTADPQSQLTKLALLVDPAAKPEPGHIWVGSKVTLYNENILRLHTAIRVFETPLAGSKEQPSLSPSPWEGGGGRGGSWTNIVNDLSGLTGGQGPKCSGRLAKLDEKICTEIFGDYPKIAAALAALNDYRKPGTGKSIAELEAANKERVAKQKESLEQAKAREANKKHGERMVDRVGKQFKDVCNGYAFDNAQKEDCVAAMETGGWDKGVNLSEGKFKSAKDENGEYFQFNPGAIKGKVAVLAPIKIYKKNGVYDYKSAYQNIAKQLESQNAAGAYTLAFKEALRGNGGRSGMADVKEPLCAMSILTSCPPSSREVNRSIFMENAAENMCQTGGPLADKSAAVTQKQERHWYKPWTWFRSNSKNTAAAPDEQVPAAQKNSWSWSTSRMNPSNWGDKTKPATTAQESEATPEAPKLPPKNNFFPTNPAPDTSVAEAPPSPAAPAPGDITQDKDSDGNYIYGRKSDGTPIYIDKRSPLEMQVEIESINKQLALRKYNPANPPAEIKRLRHYRGALMERLSKTEPKSK